MPDNITIGRGNTMGDTLPTYTAAAVQAAPVFLDRDGTIDKACELIAEAGRAGAKLIVFPETFVPMYPFWHSSPSVFSGDLFARLWKNAVEVPSPDTERLGRAAREASAYVAIGINERDTATRGTLYNTLLYFAPSGDIVQRHRKLMPTFTERTLWGFGDGTDLGLIDSPLGRLGGLICWEHEMSLVKYAMYAQGEQVHCSVWPAYSNQNDHIGFGTRQYAFEGACFVVVSCGVVPKGKLPKDICAEPVKSNGGSAIVGPNGNYLAGPIYDTEEILYAEIDLEAALREKHSRDVAGHYSRPDVMQLVMHARTAPSTLFAERSGITSIAAAAALASASLDAQELTAATADVVVDRLEAVRAYLGSLIERIESDGDIDTNAALAEALASIDLAAEGMWSSGG